MRLVQPTPFPLIRPSAPPTGGQALQTPPEVITYYYVAENQLAL